MKKAILMSRVSSEEQAKGYSLDVQLDALKHYCDRNNIMVIQTIKEDHSAKNFDRPEFKKMLEFLRKNKGAVDLLLFTSWDRFSRNTADAYHIINVLKKLGVLPQAIEQPIDFSIPENKAMLAFYLAIPEIENDRRSIKITGGIRGAWKAGRWTHKAPPGYRNGRDEKNKPILIPNEKAKLIKHAFTRIAKGDAQIDVMQQLRKKGYNVAKTTFADLLRNPLYIARIPVPADNDQPAYWSNAVHVPIISEELFYQVQDILSVKKILRNSPHVNTRREELPLRGVLKCSKCGEHVTGSPSRSRHGIKYFYYHCNHCRKERFRADKVNEIVHGIFEEFKFKPDSEQALKQMVKDALGGNQKERKQQDRVNKDQKINLEKRISNLQDLLADGKISPQDFSNMKTKYERNLIDLRVSEEDAGTSFKEMDELIDYGINKLKNINNLYESYDLAKKAKLLGSTFPEKLDFDGVNCRTPRINEFVRLTLAVGKGSKKNKTGQLTKKLVLSGCVELEGFALCNFIQFNLH